MRNGYFQCGNVGGYHADDLWDTASVLRCLLKVAEVDAEPAKSPYFERAKHIIDEWPYIDHAPDDSTYGRAGLRWYRKSNEPCENRYVKNTNIEMGEQLFRMYRLTGGARDFERAETMAPGAMPTGRLAFYMPIAGALPGGFIANASVMFFKHPPSMLWLYGVVVGAGVGALVGLVMAGSGRKAQTA